MKPFDTSRQSIAKQFGYHTQSRTGRTGIVKISLHIRKLRIDAQTARHIVKLCLRIQTFKLCERVEGNMAAAFHYFGKFTIGISRSVSMCGTAHFLESQTRFGQRTGCGIRNIFAHNGKSTPHGKSLKRQNYLHSGSVLYRFNKFQIAAKSHFVEHIAWRRYF